MKTVFAFALVVMMSVTTAFASHDLPILNSDFQVAIYKRSNGVINIAVENKENLTANSNILKIRIIDSKGKVLHTERSITSEQFSKNYNISNLEKGTYYVEVSSASQTLVKKLVIN
jgi:hypothetical protein